MNQKQQDIFAFPKLDLRSVVGSLSLILIGINAITALVSVWVGGDLLSKILWSSVNLFVAVLLAYFLIEKLLTNKGPAANTLSLLTLVSTFLLNQYIIFRPATDASEAVFLSFASITSYFIFLIAISLNVLMGHIARAPYLVWIFGVATMVFGFLASNTIAFNLVFVSTDVGSKLATSFVLLTIFSAIAVPVAKLISSRSVDKNNK